MPDTLPCSLPFCSPPPSHGWLPPPTHTHSSPAPLQNNTNHTTTLQTPQATAYLNKLPARLAPTDLFLITDPMLATGGTIVQVGGGRAWEGGIGRYWGRLAGIGKDWEGLGGAGREGAREGWREGQCVLEACG